MGDLSRRQSLICRMAGNIAAGCMQQAYTAQGFARLGLGDGASAEGIARDAVGVATAIVDQVADLKPPAAGEVEALRAALRQIVDLTQGGGLTGREQRAEAIASRALEEAGHG